MSNKTFFNRAGLQENIFILMIFGIPGLSIFISNLFNRDRRKSLGNFLCFAFCVLLGFSLLGITCDFFPLTSRLLFCLSTIVIAISVDYLSDRLWDNTFFHLVNAGYFGMAVYLWFMSSYPDFFPKLWQVILPSALKAFDMLVLCQVFLIIGYYFTWQLLYPFNKSIQSWGKSSRNLLNLSFPGSYSIQKTIFAVFIGLGLIYRLWNLSLGRIYYTEGSGVPFYISSFLAQFERLYSVALFYGAALHFDFQKNRQKSSLNHLTWGILSFELVYQLFSGSKGRFFTFIILPIASVYIFIKQKTSWLTLFVSAIVAFFSWLVVYPILVISRHLLSDLAITQNIDPLSLLTKAFQTLQLYAWNEYLTVILTPFNSSGITEQVMALTSIIHNQVSQPSHLLWQRLFMFWIPRFLWNEKPIALSANLIGRLSGRISSQDVTTSVLTTGPGELFLYYGLLGSLLMILTGLLLRFLNEAFSPFKVFTLFRVAILVAYLPLAQGFLSGGFEGNFTGIILQIGILYLVLGTIKTIMQRHLSKYRRLNFE